MFTPKFRQVQVAQEDTPLHETIVQGMDITQRHSHQQSPGHSSSSLSSDRGMLYPCSSSTLNTGEAITGLLKLIVSLFILTVFYLSVVTTGPRRSQLNLYSILKPQGVSSHLKCSEKLCFLSRSSEDHKLSAPGAMYFTG